jgi:hypothetical protein
MNPFSKKNRVYKIRIEIYRFKKTHLIFEVKEKFKTWSKCIKFFLVII